MTLRNVLNKLQCLKSLRLMSFVQNRQRFFATEAPLKWSYLHGATSTPLLGNTIGQLLERQATLTPDRDAVVFCDTQTRLTFSQLLEQSDKLAAGLASLGVKKGDRVGVWSNNRIEWIISQYATARAGYILVNINPNYIASDLQYSLEKVGCKVLISAESLFNTSYYEILEQIIPDIRSSIGPIKSSRLPDLEHVIMMGDEPYPGTLSFDDVLNAGSTTERRAIEDVQSRLQFDDPINIQFTSGTTGFPKAAKLTHHNIVNNGYFIGRTLAYHEMETRIAVPVPLYHCFGMVVGSLQTVLHGACCVFPSANFSPQATLESVHNERCTSLYGVPTMFIDVLNQKGIGQYDLTSLRTGVMAGSLCPQDVIEACITKLNMSQVTVVYGSTETSPASFQSYLTDSVEKRVSTVGRVLPHVEAKIVDGEGVLLPVGEQGELYVRGYLNMLEYWNDPIKTAEVIGQDRWYKSGDLAVIDAEGFCRIVGRKKDMIIRGGENVYPVEIENVIRRHPKVKDVQVIGVPDSRLEEEICACVKSMDDETLSVEEIRTYSTKHLARFKVPLYVVFVKQYPLTATGKVQKYKLREEILPHLTLK